MHKFVLIAGLWLTVVTSVILISLPEVLVSLHCPEIALRFPGAATVVARYWLPQLAGHQREQRFDALARAALMDSPLVEPALAWLASAPDQAATARSQYTDLAAQLGWRDPLIQASLYNQAVKSGNFGAAVRHADAIMRLAESDGAIAQSLALGANIPLYRDAVRARIREGAPWAARWLDVNGARLRDDALLDLAKAVAASPAGLSRSSENSLVANLIGAGRPAVAALIADNLAGRSAAFPRMIDWPDSAGGISDGPFDWHVGEGFIVDGGSDRVLRATQPSGASVAYRLLALPEGDYVLHARGSSTDRAGWQWAVGCGSSPTMVNWDLETDNEFSVGPNCGLQWLAVKADAGASPLSAMHVAPAEVPVK